MRGRVSEQLLQRTTRLLGALAPRARCPLSAMQTGSRAWTHSMLHVMLHSRLPPLVLGGTAWPSAQPAQEQHTASHPNQAIHMRSMCAWATLSQSTAADQRSGAGLGQAAKALQGCGGGLPALLCTDEHMLELVELHRATTGVMHGITTTTITRVPPVKFG